MMKTRILTKSIEECCTICLDEIEQPEPFATISLPCEHHFHWKCRKTHILVSGEQSTCPLCRTPLAIHTVYITPTDNELHYPRVSLALHPEQLNN